MTTILTPEQVAELERSGGSPLVVEDPRTRQGYVLVPREAYQRVRPLFEVLIAETQSTDSPALADSQAASDWDDSKNARRCALIDKKYDVGLSPSEETELDCLQNELAVHQRFVSPRPLANSAAAGRGVAAASEKRSWKRLMVPFNYPAEPHQRRHGPRGYGSAESYRPWLRDEFAFRCVYWPSTW